MLLTACSFLIPDNPSEARYNTVMGGRRLPQENARMQGAPAGGESSGMAAPVAPVYEQPVMEPQPMMTPMPEPVATQPMPPQSMNLPPVDPMTQRIAEQRMQQEAASRSVPVENMPATGSSDYPVLTNVPPAPPSAAASQARLDEVRAELERDRANASQAGSQLRRDANAEFYSPATAVTAPPPAPVASAPISPPVYNAPVYSAPVYSAPVSVPAMSAVRAPIAPLPPPPAPVYASAPAAPAPIRMDAIPMAPAATTTYYAPAPAMQPIMLRPPVSSAPPPAYAAAPAPAPAPGYQAMQPAAGSFDPMAGSTYSSGGSTTAYNGSGAYLPPSRYTYRR